MFVSPKIITVVGARPQFVKASPVSKAFAQSGIDERILHTGQHYDSGMSSVFFEELGIPAPVWNLGSHEPTHGAMTGRMLGGIEEILMKERPACVVIYGDTNSSLAGALAAAKLNIPIAHVEAGLRSYNRSMPEEINRVLVDHLASFLFCSSITGLDNLRKEGIVKGVNVTGDVMADVFYETQLSVEADLCFSARIREALPPQFDLLTIHRADTASDGVSLLNLLTCIGKSGRITIFPIHPRTRKLIQESGIVVPPSILIRDAVGYKEMVALLSMCVRVITDSGGLQKEAYWARKQCITLRSETEWIETLQDGWNVIAGTDPGNVAATLMSSNIPGPYTELYGDGTASLRIAGYLKRVLDNRE